jgi:hypothetical protein
MPGPGCFQWNTGAWFGSQLGGTAWMLVGAAVLALQAPAVAAVWLACFALANALATWLWRQRDRLRPYAALQLLVLMVGGGGLLALVALDALRPADAPLNLLWEDNQLRAVNMPPSEYRKGYLLLLVMMPLGMAFFALQEWSGRRQRARQ